MAQMYFKICLVIPSVSWSTLGGILALRAKTWVCLNKISKKKSIIVLYIYLRTKYKQKQNNSYWMRVQGGSSIP